MHDDPVLLPTMPLRGALAMYVGAKLIRYGARLIAYSLRIDRLAERGRL